MIKYENECVGCPPEMGCWGSLCPNHKVPHYYCDKCGSELDTDDIYSDDEYEHLCEECLCELHRTVVSD